MVFKVTWDLLDLKETLDPQALLAYPVLKDVLHFQRKYQVKEDLQVQWVFKDQVDGVEIWALMGLLVTQVLRVQMGTRACQVSLEYRELRVSVVKLDKAATLVYRERKDIEVNPVYLVLLECLGAVLMSVTCL